MDATLKTVVAGRLVELPGTIVAIRATMDADRATEFDREIEHLPAAELPAALVRWALTGAGEGDDAFLERLACGEDIGATEAATPGSEVA
ncbi:MULTISPECIES: hypothetical protein [unclassified Streptomyces]|uniref:hypothetical protein n=1 Tax=unclassified Streptomyces TaxID=2593676 RepID=UPI003417F838